MSVLQTVEAQPADVRNLLDAQRDRLIISFINVDGHWQALSHYGDDRWRLVDTTTNRSAASAVLSFSKLPAAFRGVMKAVIYRYLVGPAKLSQPHKHWVCAVSPTAPSPENQFTSH